MIEYLGKIGYKSGNAMQGFLISTDANVEKIININKKVIILGVCENGFYAEKLL